LDLLIWDLDLLKSAILKTPVSKTLVSMALIASAQLESQIARFESPVQIAEPKSQEIIERGCIQTLQIATNMFKSRGPPAKMFKSHCVGSNRGQIATAELSKPPQSVTIALYFASV
jgi:hypothetical protein